MMEAVRTSETSVDNHFTRQYNPEDSSEHRLNVIKNSVRTSKRTPHFTITKINWLMLFKEIIAVYSEKHTRHMNIKYSVTVTGGGTYNYHSALRVP
jgi:hypothetical protein